jgi:hypothetical protein
MILPGSYANGFAPRDGHPLYPELWRGCVGAWAPCLGPTGITLRDWSGRANHGTLTNMDPSSDWIPGSNGYALDLDGTNDTVAFADATGILCPSTITFEMWVIRTGAWETSESLWWSKPNAAFDGNGFYVEANTVAPGLTGGTGIICNGAATAYFGLTETSATTFPLNTLVHFAFGLQGTTRKIWINGISRTVTTVGSPAITSNTATKYLCSNSPGYANRYAPAQVAKIGIWNRLLSDNEVKTLSSQPGIAFSRRQRRRLVANVFNRRRRLLVGAH